jgi:hypothetical protein
MSSPVPAKHPLDGKIDNPYLGVFLKYIGSPSPSGPSISREPGQGAVQDFSAFDAYMAREMCLERFAWAVPSSNAIAAIAALRRPIVEIGAGNGYWAYLLRQLGVLSDAFDRDPPPQDRLWSTVIEGTEEVLQTGAWSGDCALMLCWPPYGSEMAERCLEKFAGDTLIHIGEWAGCTAREEFYDLLPCQLGESRSGWTLTNTVDIPQWLGIHDYLSIFSR